MSDYPLTRLGDAVTEISRRTVVVDDSEYDLLGAHWYAKGLYIKDRKKGKSIKAKYLYEVKEGDFVYNRLFGWKGAFAVAASEHEGCFVSGEFPGFKINSEKLLTRYLWYYFSLEAVWDVINAMSRGSTPTSRKRFLQDVFLKWEIPRPHLSVQKKIVAVLDLISEIIANTETSINHISSIKQGLIQCLLTRGIGHTRFKKTKMEEIPESWNLLKLSDIAMNRTERYTPKDDEHLPYVGLEHIEPEQAWIDMNGVSSETRSQKTMFRQGEVLFGKLRPYLRKVASPSFDGVCSTDILVLASKKSVTNEYLLLLLSSNHTIQHAIGTSEGTKMPRTSWNSLKQLEFPIPPIDEQERIVAAINVITGILKLEKKEELELQYLKKGLMQVLLTGKVRVKA